MKTGYKILITGGSGMLGSNLYFLWKKHHELYLISRRSPEFEKVKSYSLDITDKNKTLEIIKQIKPELIIHTAALTNVNYCQDHPAEAYEVNVKGTENIAAAARETKSFLVYISTDFVFGGQKGDYNEKDEPNPINVYGKTKLEGEKVVINSGLNFLVARTSIYGWNVLPKESFVEMIINRLRRGESVTPFTDQYFTPIYTETLGEIILFLIEKGKRGIYHISSSETVSKYEFAQLVAQEFDLNENLLQPISDRDLNLKVKRPSNVSLNVAKMLVELEIDSLKIQQDLKRMRSKENIYDQYKKNREKN